MTHSTDARQVAGALAHGLLPRLAVIFDAVEPGAKVSDIACDHVKLGIAMLRCERARAVIGIDLNAARG
jgi:tRNA A22 N-methylase